MRMRPTLAALLAFMTLAVTALPAFAQSDEEVRQKAEELDRARNDVSVGRGTLDAADAVLFGAIDAYEVTAAELRIAAANLADAEEHVRRNETPPPRHAPTATSLPSPDISTPLLGPREPPRPSVRSTTS